MLLHWAGNTSFICPCGSGAESVRLRKGWSGLSRVDSSLLRPPRHSFQPITEPAFLISCAGEVIYSRTFQNVTNQYESPHFIHSLLLTYNIICASSDKCVFLTLLDISGKVRIWDTTQKEHLLKYEYTPFSGKVKDIAWTFDNKRMAVAGDGREK